MRIDWRAVVLVLSLGLLAVACGEEPSTPGSAPSESPSASAGAPSDDQLYEGTGMVLEDAEGTVLCLGGVEDSLPPQCGGPELRGWSWEGLDFDEAGDTRWGTFTVRGTYVDDIFTLKGEPKTPEPYEGGEGDPIVAPCAEPATGWEIPDPERTTEEDRLAATRDAEREPDFSGAWIDYIEEPTDEPEMQPWGENIILVLSFTTDAERHEAAAREHWGGALCIATGDRTEAELLDVQRELSEGWLEDFGIEMTFSSTDITMGTVEVGVIVSTPEFEAELERRYGEAVVVVMPVLRPVD